MIGLLDANNFYVACERAFRPDLIGRPVAILSNNDGCIIARSNEVKALGIPMGIPYFQVKRILDQNQAAVFSSNFCLYGDMSCRMMSLLESLVPNMEVYSIDEAFIDFSGIDDQEGFACHIRNYIQTTLGLPTSLGIAPTKTLAKVATWWAKKEKKAHPVCVLRQEEDINRILATLKVEDIWGIGRRISRRLQALGIHTGLQLKNVDPRWMRQQFTVVGEKLVRELNGSPCLSLEDEEQPKKSIQVSRSFAKPLTTFDDLRPVVATYATRMGEKLRSRGLKTTSLIVSLRPSVFNKTAPFYGTRKIINFSCPVEDDFTLIKASTKALESIFREGVAWRKAGVMAFNLLPGVIQEDLFSSLLAENPRLAKLSQAIDTLNKRYGRGTLFSAACGVELSWKDQKRAVSPAYTTRWDALLTAYAK